jgi:cytochrome c-type biogenesis protein CcmF
MRNTLGTFALTVGFLTACSATLWWALSSRGNAQSGARSVGPGADRSSSRAGRRERLARAMTWTSVAAAAFACWVLVSALVKHDFSVSYVAENGGRAVPTYYTIISLWGALQGSLLLWLLILTVLTAVVMLRVHPRSEALQAPAMAVLSAIGAFFFGLSLFTSNPFHSVSPVPTDGPGPNPLLQDHPLMGVHPPLLYLGYVGLTVPFAFAMAALITGRTGQAWIEVTRRWTLAAWICLTVGVVMGSWWSYAVLGWGGYWAWDPVENASLLPWLTSTALLHSVMVQRRRGTLQLWNLVLAASSFVLVLVGTFLTRSGVVASIHSFTQSALGPVLLGFVLVVLVAVGGLLTWRIDRLGNSSEPGRLFSREGVFLANNVLLLGLAFTVLLGTVFPLIMEAVNGSRVSVGAPYFNRLALPVALTVVLLMGVGPLIPWARPDSQELLRDLTWPAAAGGSTIALLAFAGLTGTLALLTFGLAAFVFASVAGQLRRDSVREHTRQASAWPLAAARALAARRSYYGGMTVHLGFVVAAVAIAASSSYGHERTQQLTIGQSFTLGRYSATLTGIRQVNTARRHSIVADIRLRAGGHDLGSYGPALSTYPRAAQAVGTPAIRSTVSGDAYLTLTEVDPPHATATIRLATNPMVSWLWGSSAIMALGALTAAWPARRRKTAPRAARPQPEARLELSR